MSICFLSLEVQCSHYSSPGPIDFNWESGHASLGRELEKVGGLNLTLTVFSLSHVCSKRDYKSILSRTKRQYRQIRKLSSMSHYLFQQPQMELSTLTLLLKILTAYIFKSRVYDLSD